MKLTVKTLLSTFLLAISFNASAVLITEEWHATVTEIRNLTGLEVEDTFNWSVTFDDAVRKMTIWNDGPDGEADFGGDDDTLRLLQCLDGLAGGPNCANVLYRSTWNMFADAIFDFSDLPSIEGADFVARRNDRDKNNSSAFNSKYVMVRELRADDFLFYAGDGVTNYLQLSGLNDDENYSWASAIFVSTLVSVEQVPAPGTIALFGLGLAGLGFARRKKT